MNRRSFLGSILAAAAAPAIVRAEVLMKLAPQRVAVPSGAEIWWISNPAGPNYFHDRFVEQYKREFIEHFARRASVLRQVEMLSIGDSQ